MIVNDALDAASAPAMDDAGAAAAAGAGPAARAATPDFQRPVYAILGLPFDALDMADSQRRLEAALVARQRCFFSTPNLNFLVSCLSAPGFRDSVLRSDLSFADGMPIIWIARALGLPINTRVAGSTLFELLRQQTRMPVKVFFFGGPDGVAARAGEVLNAQGGAMTCVGTHSPGFGSIVDMSGAAVIEQINASGADFLVVALGAKKGQQWIEHNLPQLDAALVSHLGAVVNFVAGTITRAPSKVGGLGLEWLWRIKEEPGLWRRYWSDGLAFLRLLTGRVLPGAWAAARQRRMRGKAAAGTLHLAELGHKRRLTLTGAWYADTLAPLRDALTSLTAVPGDVALDLGQASVLDAAALGLLMLLYGHQTKIGYGFAITAVSDPVRRALYLSCAEYLLAPVASRHSTPI